MSNGSNTNSCMAHAFYSGIYLYGLTQWGPQIRYGNSHGFTYFIEKYKAISLISIFVSHSNRSESRSNEAIVMIFAAHFLFFFMKVAKLLRIKSRINLSILVSKRFSISVRFCRYVLRIRNASRKKKKKEKKSLSRDFPFLLAEACDFDL